MMVQDSVAAKWFLFLTFFDRFVPGHPVGHPGVCRHPVGHPVGHLKATAAAYSEHNQVEMRRLMVSPWRTEELASEASSMSTVQNGCLQVRGGSEMFWY